MWASAVVKRQLALGVVDVTPAEPGGDLGSRPAALRFIGRELIARGHEVRLTPAQYVKPCVKRGMNDTADAEATCEAVTRPTMRFVPVETPEQQSAMMLHRVRLMLNRQRTETREWHFGQRRMQGPRE